MLSLTASQMCTDANWEALLCCLGGICLSCHPVKTEHPARKVVFASQSN